MPLKGVLTDFRRKSWSQVTNHDDCMQPWGFKCNLSVNSIWPGCLYEWIGQISIMRKSPSWFKSHDGCVQLWYFRSRLSQNASYSGRHQDASVLLSWMLLESSGEPLGDTGGCTKWSCGSFLARLFLGSCDNWCHALLISRFDCWKVLYTWLLLKTAQNLWLVQSVGLLTGTGQWELYLTNYKIASGP